MDPAMDADDGPSRDREKGRGSYRCGRCGVPKKGHVCPYQPKLKRRPDEPPPETRNASTQVEMDEFLILRRLNLEIQGFPESYAADPIDMVGAEARSPATPMEMRGGFVSTGVGGGLCVTEGESPKISPLKGGMMGMERGMQTPMDRPPMTGSMERGVPPMPGSMERPPMPGNMERGGPPMPGSMERGGPPMPGSMERGGPMSMERGGPPMNMERGGPSMERGGPPMQGSMDRNGPPMSMERGGPPMPGSMERGGPPMNMDRNGPPMPGSMDRNGPSMNMERGGPPMPGSMDRNGPPMNMDRNGPPMSGSMERGMSPMNMERGMSPMEMSKAESNVTFFLYQLCRYRRGEGF